MTTPENPNPIKNNLENSEVPKVTPENLEPKEISNEEFSDYSKNEEIAFKNETTEEMEKSNSVNLDEETFEKVKNETGVEEELAEIDRESEKIVAESQQEIGQGAKTPEKIDEQEKMKNVTESVQKLYFELADKHLDEKSPLKEKIINFYSDFDRLQNELKVVFKGLSEGEISKKIEEVKERLNDKTFFVEHYQKIFERTEVFNGIKNRMMENPLATQEEYDLGVYKEGLETQVRDACFSLQKKGYKTFESGFREKEGNRDQYLGMYNKNIDVPESVTDYFKEKQFEISIIHHDDRTVINIHPENADAVTLDEWKKIWDELAEKLPVAKEEDFSKNKKYSLHTSFRERQDNLRAGKNS
jgi:hypothetical protein